MNRMSPKEAVKWLGVKDGKLSHCPPDMKNCVCSTDSGIFQVDPIALSGEDAIEKIVAAVSALAGYTLEKQDGDYAHFTFKTSVFKFTDDIEFLRDDSGVVHIRSASRLGYWDIGANRKRVEALRKLLQSL